MFECVEFKGCKTHNGYGQLTVGSFKRWRAHRYAWTLRYGPIPQGMLVLHDCDNRACVNTDHMRLGSPRDNSDDMVVRNRKRGRPFGSKDSYVRRSRKNLHSL